MKFQDREYEIFLSTTPMVGRPADVRPIPHPTPKCSAPIFQANPSIASRA